MIPKHAEFYHSVSIYLNSRWVIARILISSSDSGLPTATLCLAKSDPASSYMLPVLVRDGVLEIILWTYTESS